MGKPREEIVRDISGDGNDSDSNSNDSDAGDSGNYKTRGSCRVCGIRNLHCTIISYDKQ